MVPGTDQHSQPDAGNGTQENSRKARTVMFSSEPGDGTLRFRCGVKNPLVIERKGKKKKKNGGKKVAADTALFMLIMSLSLQSQKRSSDMTDLLYCHSSAALTGIPIFTGASGSGRYIRNSKAKAGINFRLPQLATLN